MLEFDDDEDVELERRNRIRLSIAAYLYETGDEFQLMTDAEYDRISYQINTSVGTGHPVLDKFFREEFQPDTGQWIHKHPELDKLIQRIYNLKQRNMEKNTNGLRKTQKRP